MTNLKCESLTFVILFTFTLPIPCKRQECFGLLDKSMEHHTEEE